MRQRTMWREPSNCKKLGKELSWRSPGTFSTPLLVLYSSPFTSSWTSSWSLVASTASSGGSIECGHSTRPIRPEIFSTWFCSFHRWMMVLLYNFQMAQSGQVWDWWLLHGSLLAWSFSNFSQQRRWFALLIGSMDDWLKLAAIPIWSHGKSLAQGESWMNEGRGSCPFLDQGLPSGNALVEWIE